MKKLFCLLICIALMVPVFVSCGKAPEYAEIDERFRELVEASAEINMIFFGEGLPTYERITDPRETTEIYQNTETGEEFYYYTFEDDTYGEMLAYRLHLTTRAYTDPETATKYFYYDIYDAAYGKIIVAKTSEGENDYYVQICNSPKDGEEAVYTDESKGVYGYLLEDFSYDRDLKQEYTFVQLQSAADNSRTAIYEDEAEKIWCYVIEDYVEPTYESFYDENDPLNYDYVRFDCEYRSVNEVKAAAELVYSEDYLNSIYNSMFEGSTGVTESVNGLSARYIQYATEDGNSQLMKSNTYEPLISEVRQYDYSTAKIGSNSSSKFVYIEIDSFLPSKPDQRLNVTITMIYENGQWMLDSPTY